MPTPERLYLLRLSTTNLPLPNGMLELVSGCYLIRMSDGQNILVDSGLPADYSSPPGTPPAENVSSVIEQLQALDLQPAEIDLLICTHFDIDHVGYNDAFPRAEIIVQRKQYESAQSGGSDRYSAGRAHWHLPPERFRLLDGDSELLPGLRLIETSGHAPGHQSVLLHLPQTGKVLLTIDAVPLQRFFTPERPAWPEDDDLDAVRASTRKLLNLVARESVALVIFGHDGRQWQSLKRAPQFYD